MTAPLLLTVIMQLVSHVPITCRYSFLVVGSKWLECAAAESFNLAADMFISLAPTTAAATAADTAATRQV